MTLPTTAEKQFKMNFVRTVLCLKCLRIVSMTIFCVSHVHFSDSETTPLGVKKYSFSFFVLC